MKGFKLVFVNRAQSKNLGLTLTFRDSWQSEAKKKSDQRPNYFWLSAEHVHFLMLCNKYGRDWKVISEHICGSSH